MEKLKIVAPQQIDYVTTGSAGFDIPALPQSSNGQNNLQDGFIPTLDFLNTENYLETQENPLWQYWKYNINCSSNIGWSIFNTSFKLYFKRFLDNNIEWGKNESPEDGYTKAQLNTLPKYRILLPWETGIIRTGIYSAIPTGKEIQIRPRSGISCKHHWQVQLGTIDSDYRGEWGVIFQNKSAVTYIITEGERIAQAVYKNIEQAEFEFCSREELDETARGEGGFGSTGTK